MAERRVANLCCGHVACQMEVAAAVDAAREQGRREGWDEAIDEAHGLGWLHDWAKSDALARNPYRIEAEGDGS